jgi:hypothetical protein
MLIRSFAHSLQFLDFFWMAACSGQAETLVLGIRLSVYLPALFTTLPIPLLLSRKPETTQPTLHFPTGEYSFLLSLALLLTSFALSPRTVFDAVIVLNLIWINISSAFARFLFDTYTIPQSGFGIRSLALHNKKETFKWNHPRWRRQAFLFCLHLTLLSCFGLWLWTTVSTFGGQPKCTAQTTVVIFNYNVKASSSVLYHQSIAVYALFVAPFVNILILGFLIIVTAEVIFFCASVLWLIVGYVLITTGVWREGVRRKAEIFSVVTMSIGILFMESIFIADIERMIKINGSNFAPSEQDDWTFGPILAMLLIIIPLSKFLRSLPPSILPSPVRAFVHPNKKEKQPQLAAPVDQNINSFEPPEMLVPARAPARAHLADWK